MTIHFAILLPLKEKGLKGVSLPTPQGRDLNSLGRELPMKTHGTDFAARRPNGRGNYSKDAGFSARLHLQTVYVAKSAEPLLVPDTAGRSTFSVSFNPSIDPRREALFLSPFYKPDN